MAKKTGPDQPVQFTVYLPPSLIDLIDERVAEEADRTGFNVSRTAVVRRVLAKEMKR